MSAKPKPKKPTPDEILLNYRKQQMLLELKEFFKRWEKLLK